MLITDTSQRDEHPIAATNTRRWTVVQRQIVLNHFKSILEGGTLPSGAEIQELITEKESLRNKTIPQIRAWLHFQKNKFFTPTTTKKLTKKNIQKV